MLAFSVKTYLKMKEERARSRQPRLRSFGQIFKEEATAIGVLHSQSAQAQYLSRHSALGFTSLALKNWLRQWVRGGGIALL